MEDVVIVDAARSPVGRKNGSLGGAHPTDVLGQVMMQLLARNDLASATVDQVVGGCINNCLLYTSPSPRDSNLSRMPSSA